MNKDNFLNYQGDIEKYRKVSSLPEAHQQAFEIIKEGSDNFTNWDQFISILDDPDILELTQLHLAWLDKVSKDSKDEMPQKQAKKTSKAKRTNKIVKPQKEKTFKYDGKIYSEQEIIDFAETTLHYEDEDNPISFSTGSEALKALKKSEAATIRTTKKRLKQKVTGGEVRYGDDVKFIRSFLAFLSSDQGRNRMANLYKRLSRQNAEKRFSNSKHKPELNEIATLLHDSINQGKSRVVVPASFKEKLLAIREANHLSASVQVIKRFYNWIGSTPDIKQAENLLKSANKIDDSDKYYPEVKRIIYRLEKFIEDPKTGVTIDKPTIEGLAGVLKSCGCKLSRGKWEDAATKKA